MNNNENAIAKSCYLPFKHYQIQSVAELQRVPSFKDTALQNLTLYAKKSYKSISIFKCKGIVKIKSGDFMFLSTLISSSQCLYLFMQLTVFIQTIINN